MATPAQIYLQSFSNLVDALKSGDHNRITAAKQIYGTEQASSMPTILDFVIVILEKPMVFIQLLLTLVYMQTFGSKITDKVKELFRDLTYQDTINLCDSPNNLFFRDRSLTTNSETNSELQESAIENYNSYVKVYSGKSPAEIDRQINTMVKIANALLGNEAGSKALVACQSTVWSSGAATLLVSYGCENNIGGLDQASCEAARRAKAALTTPVSNTSL